MAQPMNFAHLVTCSRRAGGRFWASIECGDLSARLTPPPRHFTCSRVSSKDVIWRGGTLQWEPLIDRERDKSRVYCNFLSLCHFHIAICFSFSRSLFCLVGVGVSDRCLTGLQTRVRAGDICRSFAARDNSFSAARIDWRLVCEVRTHL